LDKLTAMQMGLVSLWDRDATIHPLGPAKRLQARDALSTAIVDLLLLSLHRQHALRDAYTDTKGPGDLSLAHTIRR